MRTEGDAVDLVDVVRRAREGHAPPQDVFNAFLRARVYCERPQEPGFLAVTVPEAVAGDGGPGPRSRLLDLVDGTLPKEPTPPAARLVPVFSSLEQFSLFAGEGAWFSTTGADVLDLLPTGLDVWLDPAAEHAVRLASAATGVEPVLRISYRNQVNRGKVS
ncbi:SseB family protein [Streptomyces sp. NPDC051636]|uniref:SseB family protein n=1 Tax=Streptomyces sp. NPDC051636 TaxID=3365663 RepID=UPI0037B0AA3C